jgi:hypothetical protein
MGPRVLASMSVIAKQLTDTRRQAIYSAKRRSVSAFFSIASRIWRRCSSGVPGRPDLSLDSVVAFVGEVSGTWGFITQALWQSMQLIHQ